MNQRAKELTMDELIGKECRVLMIGGNEHDVFVYALDRGMMKFQELRDGGLVGDIYWVPFSAIQMIRIKSVDAQVDK